MALSNYVGSSLATMLIFSGTGFGLAGDLSMRETLLVAFAIFLAQLPLSTYWLRHYNYGPLDTPSARSRTPNAPAIPLIGP